jgi:hypothetical protein
MLTKALVVNVTVTPEHVAAPSKRNNYRAENWQYGTNFCGLFFVVIPEFAGGTEENYDY